MQKDITIPQDYKRKTLLDYLLKSLSVYDYEKAMIDLKKELDISDSLISQWRNDKREISSKHLNTLASYFGVTEDQLLMKESKAA